MAVVGTKVGEICVAGPGIQVSSGVASASSPIPNAANGLPAKYIRVAVATGAAYVMPGPSAVVATAAGLLVTVGDAVILNVHGFTHIAYIQETGAVKINVTPLEVG